MERPLCGKARQLGHPESQFHWTNSASAISREVELSASSVVTVIVAVPVPVPTTLRVEPVTGVDTWLPRKGGPFRVVAVDIERDVAISL